MDLKTYFKTNSQSVLAKALGVTPGAVNQWANGLSAVAAERCPAIERATGGLVTCEELRPDVPWSVLRGVPAPAPASPEPAAEPAGLLRDLAAEARRQSIRREQDAQPKEARRQPGPPFQTPEVGVA